MVESHSLQNNRWAYILNSALGFQEWLITVKYEDEQGGKKSMSLGPTNSIRDKFSG